MEPRLLWISGASASPLATALAAIAPVESCPAGTALERLRLAGFSAVVVEGAVVDPDPFGLLEEICRLHLATPVLLYQPGITVALAVQLAHRGIRYFPESESAVVQQVREIVEARATAALASLATAVQRDEWERMLVGRSVGIRQVADIIRLVGPRRATVLITGETGTGKEIAARALHLAGPRQRGPFVALNCSALPETLLEAELFGHVRGAFTGALQSRAGRFEQAQGGTLFLDEIGDMTLELQAKLLRVLQERELQRLGGSDTVRLDVRVVAATNADLAAAVESGRFREDLYYRLNVVPLQMPPLRHRLDDVPVLATHFINKVCHAEELPGRSLAADALDRLCAYSWPGNVRQLENAIEMAVSLCGERLLLAAADFPLPAAARPRPTASVAADIDLPDSGLDFEQTVHGIERSILEQALKRTGGNKKAAAEMLGLKRTTLAAKVRGLAGTACN